mmetsp:Transcript_28934/g.43698  ORF Transcript_28934/g.43698 Transcript_28934/m.43698 type:complete len:272 (+) Transcript_28934:180-995(+)
MGVFSFLRFWMWYSFRQPTVLFVIGATIGIGLYHIATLQGAAGAGCSNNIKESGTLLAQLIPQPRYFPSPIEQHLSSSKPMFVDASTKEYTYYMPCGKNCHAFQRAVRSLGWIKLDSIDNAILVFTDMTKADRWELKTSNKTELKSWQRYNHLPNRQNFTTRESFLDTLHTHTQRNDPEFDFFPDTYRMHATPERRLFERAINENERGAYWKYWNPNLKTTYVHSKQAGNVVKSYDKSGTNKRSYMTKYTCNPMTWSDGNTFIIRVFWLVS